MPKPRSGPRKESKDAPAWDQVEPWKNSDFASKKMVLSVNGMSCAKNCGAKLQQVLFQVDGVDWVTVDFPARSVTLYLSKQVTMERLSDYLSAAGPSSCNRTLSLSPPNSPVTLCQHTQNPHQRKSHNPCTPQVQGFHVVGMMCMANCGRCVPVSHDSLLHPVLSHLNHRSMLTRYICS